MKLRWLLSDAEREAGHAFMAAHVPHLHGGTVGEAVLGCVENARGWAAVAAFYGWREDAGTLMVSVAYSSPRWCRPPVIRAILQYAFGQAGAQLLHGATPSNNRSGLRFLRKIGFHIEPPLRRRYGPQIDAVPFSMTIDEWRQSRWCKELPQ